MEAGVSVRTPALVLALLVAAGPLHGQSFTGEFRAVGIGAYAPQVDRRPGDTEPIGPPGDSPMAGGMWDISFITGRLRVGPEGFVLRGPERRVWSLGGIARYELGTSAIRPYGLLGAGAYFWDSEYLADIPPYQPFRTWGSDVNLISLSLGGGVNLGSPRGRLSGIAELRVHRSLQGKEQKGSRAMVSLGLGGRVAW